MGAERVPIDAVTGATSYTGRFIAAELAERGRTVLNLTRGGRARHRGTFAPAASAEPGMVEIRFPPQDGAALSRALEGADTLYNTHWIRFERGDVTYQRAIDETRELLEAARAAGVRRFVHVSVIHASHDAPTAYFRAKAAAEDVVRELAPSHAIVRPTVTFGPGDILVNNLAWTLRRLPVFGIPGDGRYPIQAVHVADIARIAIEAGEASGNPILDAAGPDRLTFDQFVRVVRSAVRSRSLVVPMPVPVALLAARTIGAVVRDVVLRRDEVTELQVGLMVSDQPPLGRIGFSDWVHEHADELGRHWSSELERHYRGRVTAARSAR
jgi:nucleoside-diphosphate-sugar epimerase